MIGDIYHSDGTLNYGYIKWLVAFAEKRGWLKRTRWLNKHEVQNALAQGKGNDAR